MLDICSWDNNCTFLQLLPSKVFITTWVPKWLFWAINSKCRSNSRSIFGLYILILISDLFWLLLWSHLNLTWSHCGGGGNGWGCQLCMQILLQLYICVVLAMSLRYRLEWFKLSLHSKSSFNINFLLIFCEIHYCSINSDLSDLY